MVNLMSSQSGPPVFRRIAQYKSPQVLRDRLSELECELPCDDEILTASDGSSLAKPIEIGGFTVGNRWYPSYGRLGCSDRRNANRKDTEALA